MAFCIPFQVSSTAHYEILLSKTHTIYTMQHLRILCINLTTMIRKRIHLFFYYPVAWAQKDWKPQQYLLLLFLLAWHFLAQLQCKRKKANHLRCFAGKGIWLWTKVKTENLKLLSRGGAAETWHSCVTKILLWQTQLPEFKQVIDRTIFCSSNKQLLHRRALKVTSEKNKLHQDVSVISNALKKLTPSNTYLKPSTLSRRQSAYFLPTDHA